MENQKPPSLSMTTMELASKPVRSHTRARARTQAHARTHNWAVAGEVDTSLIIEGPRRKRAAAAKAQQSSEWTSLLAGKLNALGDSDSDSD